MGKVLVTLAALILILHAQDQYAAQRERMVREQIESRGIHSHAVLKAVRATPRHLFMPVDARSAAYEDHPVPIGYGQTISQPYIVAFMTDILRVEKDHKVLEIGTGSGYQAAILSALAKEVYTIEIVPELARSASQTLQQMGYKNVFVRGGDGYRGWPENAPFDRIILTAAPPSIPEQLVMQLKAGGKLVAPVGAVASVQEIVVLDKGSDGKVTTRSILPVRFVPMVRP